MTAELLRPVFAARSCLLSTYKPRKALLRTCYLHLPLVLSGHSAAVEGAVGVLFEALQLASLGLVLSSVLHHASRIKRLSEAPVDF